jgi:hypothetical protein
MKKGLKFRRCLAAVLLFLYISCAKHHDNPTADCITRVPDTASQTSTVTAAQLNAILALFQRNNLPTAGLQFVAIDSNIYEPPGYSDSVSQVMVVANLFINGLPTFSGGVAFYFYNEVYQTNLTHYGTASSTDTSTHQTLEDLRTAWLTHYQQDSIFGGTLNSRPSVPGLAYRDSCLLAELGYIDAATFANAPRTYGVSLVKAWKVSPLNGGYPMVYVQDSTGVCVPVQEALP